MKTLIDNEFISREDFYKAFFHTLPRNMTNINFDELLKVLYLKFDYIFFDENYINEFNFNELDSGAFHNYTEKFHKFIKYYQKTKDINKLKKVLNLYYKFGVLHHHCWGNYHLSLGWTHNLAMYKIRRFNPDEYNYDGIRIKYLEPIAYHNKFLAEYNEVRREIDEYNFNQRKNKNLTFDEYIKLSVIIEDYKKTFTMDFNEYAVSDEYFNDDDYKLFDKYLIN